MNDREIRRYDMAGRVQTFGNNHTADFAAGSKAAAQREKKTPAHQPACPPQRLLLETSHRKTPREKFTPSCRLKTGRENGRTRIFYKKFGIASKEIAFIEKVVRPLDVSGNFENE